MRRVLICSPADGDCWLNERPRMRRVFASMARSTMISSAVMTNPAPIPTKPKPEAEAAGNANSRFVEIAIANCAERDDRHMNG